MKHIESYRSQGFTSILLICKLLLTEAYSKGKYGIICCQLAVLWVTMGTLTGCMEKRDIKNPVYICTGYSAECYHSHSSCKGIQKCCSSIEMIDLEDAKNAGRRPCGYCYRH